MAKKSKTGKKGLIEIGIGVISKVASDATVKSIKALEKQGKINKKTADNTVKYVVKKYSEVGAKYGKDLQVQFDKLVKDSTKAANSKYGKELQSQFDKLVKESIKMANSKYAKDFQSQLDNFVKESVKANPFVTRKDFDELKARLEKLAKDASKKSKK